MPIRPAVPAFVEHLVDDAAIFPPGSAPLDRAVHEHVAHRTAPHAELVGGFVVSDVKLPDLIAQLSGTTAPLAVNVVVTGGAGAIEPAVRWAVRADELELRAVEFALRDEDDLAHNARRVVAVVDSLEEELAAVEVYVEPPPLHAAPSHGWLAALDELAARELRLKFRTGGASAADFPAPAELATCIDASLDRELPFKCTAGLHNAVRHRDPQTGFDHHGFLNVLLATRATLDGHDAAEVLAETEPARLLDGLEADALAGARRWFTSFGSCSVTEPLHDLVALGLLEVGS